MELTSTCPCKRRLLADAMAAASPSVVLVFLQAPPVNFTTCHLLTPSPELDGYWAACSHLAVGRVVCFGLVRCSLLAVSSLSWSSYLRPTTTAPASTPFLNPIIPPPEASKPEGFLLGCQNLCRYIVEVERRLSEMHNLGSPPSQKRLRKRYRT